MAMSGHSSHRLGKYKYTTPPWKEVYRQRCLKRLREGRSKLLDKFRKLDSNESEDAVKEVMKEEWNVLCKEKNSCLSQNSIYNPFATRHKHEDEDLNDLIDIMEEIQNELILEEQQMLRLYEEGLQFEEERLCASIQCLLSDDVICPICKKNPLLQNKQVIFCSCGVRINTENDAVTLDFVKSQLQDAMEQHNHRNAGCFEEALFSVSSYPELGISNLIMACKVSEIAVSIFSQIDGPNTVCCESGQLM